MKFYSVSLKKIVSVDKAGSAFTTVTTGCPAEKALCTIDAETHKLFNFSF